MGGMRGVVVLGAAVGAAILFRLRKGSGNEAGSNSSSSGEASPAVAAAAAAAANEATAARTNPHKTAAITTSSSPASKGPVNPSDSVSMSSTTEAQEAVLALQQRYTAMAQDFRSQGLDLGFISEMQAWFQGARKEEPGCPWPVRYHKAPVPLPPHSARLLVIPVTACNPALGALAQKITSDIMALLPPSWKVFYNGRQDYHITIFHASHPQDPRLHALPPLNTSATTTTTSSSNKCSSSSSTTVSGNTDGTRGIPSDKDSMGRRISIEEDNDLLSQEVTVTDDAVHVPPAAYAVQAVSGGTSKLAASDGKEGDEVSVPVQVDELPATTTISSSGSTGGSTGGGTVQQVGSCGDAHAGLAGPCPKYLVEEEGLVGEIVAACKPPTLKADRVLMARSGTLLLTWTDPSGQVGHLRHQLRTRLPGATSRQAAIIHTSLARIVTPEALPGEVVEAMAAAAERWTWVVRDNYQQQQHQQQQGFVFVPDQAWWVIEEEFSTVVGNRVPMSFSKLV